MKLWIARCKNNDLYLFKSKPVCGEDGIFRMNETDSDDIISLDSSECPEVMFENSPQEVSLNISPGGLKIGDLVETCAMHPGFITSINGDDVSVFIPTKLQVYNEIYGGCHSIHHCGVHRISTEYAMMLFSFTEDELKDMFDRSLGTGEYWEDFVKKEYYKKLGKKD